MRATVRAVGWLLIVAALGAVFLSLPSVRDGFGEFYAAKKYLEDCVARGHGCSQTEDPEMLGELRSYEPGLYAEGSLALDEGESERTLKVDARSPTGVYLEIQMDAARKGDGEYRIRRIISVRREN